VLTSVFIIVIIIITNSTKPSQIIIIIIITNSTKPSQIIIVIMLSSQSCPGRHPNSAACHYTYCQ